MLQNLTLVMKLIHDLSHSKHIHLTCGSVDFSRAVKILLLSFIL